MNNRTTNIVKAVLLIVLMLAPWCASLIWVVQIYGDHPPRLFVLADAIYLFVGMWVYVTWKAKTLNKQLALSPDLALKPSNAYRPSDFSFWTIETAYVSSVAHLQRFRGLPWYSKLLGLMLGDFPNVRFRAGILPSTHAFPLVYFARGEISLSPSEFEFVARAPSSARGSYSALYSNLDTKLSFVFQPHQIASVDVYDVGRVMPASVTSVSLPFIRIRTTTGQLRDFLVCSGSENRSEIAPETERLFVALRSFAANDRAARVQSP